MIKYNYRNLPFIQTREMWVVEGKDRKTISEGILEWCVDEADALWIKRQMESETGRFKNLKVYQYQQGE